MTQKYYLHSALSSATGTLPSSSTQSGLTPSVTAGSAGNNRAMDGTVGTAQTNANLTSLANTSAQPSWFGKWLTPPLQAQTSFTPTTGSIHAATKEANANANFKLGANIYAWRPSTGAVVARMIASNTLISTATEAGTAQTAVTISLSTASATTWQDGDILVLELWRDSTVQGAATAYLLNTYFDGTTDDSITSNAAYIDFGADLPLYVAPVFSGWGVPIS